MNIVNNSDLNTCLNNACTTLQPTSCLCSYHVFSFRPGSGDTTARKAGRVLVKMIIYCSAQNWQHHANTNLLPPCFHGPILYSYAGTSRNSAVYLNVQGTISYSFQLFLSGRRCCMGVHSRSCRGRTRSHFFPYQFYLSPSPSWPSPCYSALANRWSPTAPRRTSCSRWRPLSASGARLWTVSRRVRTS